MKQSSKLLSSFLAVVFIISTVVPLGALAARSLSDVKGHWAETYISSAITRGYVNGYQNGSFQPNKPVTRAEFCKMMNNALSLSEYASVDFKDVSSSNWYYNDVRKALAAEYISGYDDNSFRANNLMTRQEAAVILSRIVSASNDSKSLSDMKDSSSIASWAKDAASTVYSKGYMAGDNQKKFNPKGNLTRGEAVKIIESVLNKEAMTNSNLSITNPNQLNSNTIYTGNITVRLDSNSDATFQNCRILGTLQISGGDTIRLVNTKVNNLVVNNTSGEVEIQSSGKSDIHNTTVSGACTLNENSSNGTGFENVNLLGSDLRNRKVTLSGAFPSVSVSSPSNLYLLSGSISLLTISSNGKGSKIDLSSSGTVNRVEINGASDFVGKGTIKKAILNESGSTFETAPLSTEGRTTLMPSIYPANGASNVSVKDSIRITYNESIYTTSGAALSNSYVEDSVVELRKNSASGSKVPFSCTLYSDKREFSIKPTDTLDKSTKYYVIIKSALKNSAGNRNDSLTFSFSTVGGLTPEVYPVNGSDTIPVTSKITLTFDQALSQRNGNYITSSYLTDSVIDLRRDSSGGSHVDFYASISSDRKTITVTPTNNLSTNTRYYVTLKDNCLTNTDNISNSEQTFSFTTASSRVLVPVITPASGSSAVRTTSDIELTFDSSVYTANGSSVNSSYLRDNVFTLRSGSASGSTVSFSASINSGKTKITIDPDYTLSTNTTYYLIMQSGSLSDSSSSSRNYNDKQVYSFTTDSGRRTTLEPSPYPSYGASNVSTDRNITLTFDESIYQSNYSRSEITSSYLRNSVLELRKGNSSGDTVSFSASIDRNREITITPDRSLSADTKYYVIVRDGSIQNSNGDRNQKYITYFTCSSTSSSFRASMTPANGSSGVSPSTNISLSFEDVLYDKYGNSLSSSSDSSRSYLRNTAIELHSGSENGSTVSFSVNSITNSRWISLTPNSTLSDKTTYYVVIPEGTLKLDDGTTNRRLVYSFTVGSILDIQITPRNGTQNVDKSAKVTLSFNEQVYNSSNTMLTKDNIASYMNSIATLRSSKGAVSTSATINNSGTEITLQPYSPLDANTTYTLTIPENRLSNRNGSKNADISISFTTVSDPSIPTPTVSCSAPTASGTQDITLTFDRTVYNSSKQALDASYLQSNLKLYKDSSSGTSLPFTATCTNNVMTLKPTALLNPDATYYVVANQGVLCDSSGNKNLAFAPSFKTKAPQIKLDANTITETSAKLVVGYDYPCKFNVTVSKDGQVIETLATDKVPNANVGSFSWDLSGLTQGTQYTLTVKYQYPGGSELVSTLPFNTYKKSDNSTLKSLSVKDVDGTSEVTLTDPKNGSVACSVSVKPSELTITPVTTDPKSTVAVTGATAANGGYELTLGDSTPATVTITVTAEDGTNTQYILTITPTPK